jgi:hypothetical protein
MCGQSKSGNRLANADERSIGHPEFAFGRGAVDLERQRKDEAKLAGKKFKPAIEPPYRWRDWAAQADGIAKGGRLGSTLAVCISGFRLCRQHRHRLMLTCIVVAWTSVSL